jgi:ketosteroid isomerase-like protein
MMAAADAAPARIDSPAEAFVEAFTDGWRAPIDADHFAEHFEPLLDPNVRLIQPGAPTTTGREAFRERFARPLFDLIPDLHGTVEGWAVREDTVYIELRLEGTVGRRPVMIRTCDRITLRDGRVVERLAHLDPTPLLAAVALTLRAWPRAIRQQLTSRR